VKLRGKGLRREESLAIVVTTVAFVVIVAGIYTRWWPLSSVLSPVPEVIMLSLVPLWVWTLWPRISKAWLGKLQHNPDDREKKDAFGSHSNKLRTELVTAFTEAYDKLQPAISLSRTFRLWTEFMQHLYTGYREIHSFVVCALDFEKKTSESARQLYEKIEQRIRREFGREITFQTIVQEEHPTFDPTAFIRHIIEEIELDKWQGFDADTEASRRNIVSQNQRFPVDKADKAFVDQMAIRLTKVVSDSEIQAAISSYRDIRKAKEEKSNKANQQLEQVIKAPIHGEILGGACWICLKYHDPKDIPRLQHELSQLH
jgi:hypothetical protein